MTPTQRIKDFWLNNKPFYICDHKDGSYSLCLPFTFLKGEYENYCQNAFDRYAAEHGECPTNEYGLHIHGSGYEWDRVFQEAFRDDPDIGKIRFDSEAGGFFCDADDLAVLERLGASFREICGDEQRFQSVVDAALSRPETPDLAEDTAAMNMKM